MNSLILSYLYYGKLNYDVYFRRNYVLKDKYCPSRTGACLVLQIDSFHELHKAAEGEIT